MKVRPVLKEHIHQVWPLVEGFLAASVAESKGDFKLEHVKLYLVQGGWQLLVVVDEEETVHGAVAVQFVDRPDDRVAFVTALGGKFITNKDAVDSFKAYVKSCGATKSEAAVRDSVARLFIQRHGFNDKYRMVEVAI